ncbi:uncharacterized protein [Physcomitrium patens]|uniref:Uncharacterized protein n=1 Tax=Physcomitrium patens TaxID=3218 RepID=A0A7I4D0X2_PHYPA
MMVLFLHNAVTMRRFTHASREALRSSELLTKTVHLCLLVIELHLGRMESGYQQCFLKFPQFSFLEVTNAVRSSNSSPSFRKPHSLSNRKKLGSLRLLT